MNQNYRLNTNKLFLFSSVGSKLSDTYKTKVFQSWDYEKVDNGCVIFEKEKSFNYSKYFNICLCRFGFKFPNFFYFLSKIKDISNNYEYFAVLDDDLFFNQSQTLQKCMFLMDHYDLDICSISNSNNQKKTPYSVMAANKLRNEIWITNFCELGFMIIRQNLLNCFIDYYNSNLKNRCLDWGMDFAISNFANDHNNKIGIIKNMTFTNPEQKIRNYSVINLDTSIDKYVYYHMPKIINKYTI